MSEFVITARFETRPGAEAEGETELVRLAELSRAEAGCLAYDVYRVVGASHMLVLFERWTDEDAWRTHLETPHVQTLRGEFFTSVPPGTRLEPAERR